MYTIYLLTTPAYHESEDMVFRYVMYDDEEKVVKDGEIEHPYRKPLLTGMYGIMEVLKAIPEYKRESITFVVNDGALVEQVKGTTTTKNKDVLKVAQLTNKHMDKFSDTILIKSVAGDHDRMKEWEKKLNV